METEVSRDEIQVVAILPGGQFLGLGLIEVANVDVLIRCLVSRDERTHHAISPIDVRRAYGQAKAAQLALETGRASRGLNNGAEDGGA